LLQEDHGRSITSQYADPGLGFGVLGSAKEGRGEKGAGIPGG